MLKMLSNKFTDNPIAWILLGLLFFSVYSHYQTGKKFTEVCIEFKFYKELKLELNDQIFLNPKDIISKNNMKQMNKISYQIEKICDDRLHDY